MIHIFYHNADLDGHCSGAICKYAMPEAKLHGINYGDPFPWKEIGGKDTVYIVDFSLQPFSDMIKLNDYLDGLHGVVWIDHHKSAIEDYYADGQKLILQGRRDINYAACELCWQYFHKSPMPLSVYWLGRYDIWRHEDVPGALDFQYGMRMHETDPTNHSAMLLWERLFHSGCMETDSIKNEGSLILRYEKEQNRKFAAAYAFETKLDGLLCIAVNKGFTNSLVFESVYDPAKHDAMLAFALRGGKWIISLYSTKPEVDVSVICKARGGGGHKGAAGFQCEVLPFIERTYHHADKHRFHHR